MNLDVCECGAAAQYVSENVEGADNFVLVDVGASGGIHKMWDAIGDRLTGFGFDPNRIACAELTEIERKRGRGIEFVPACLIAPTGVQPIDSVMTYPLGRLAVEAVLSRQNRSSDSYFTPTGLDFVPGFSDHVPKIATEPPLSLHHPVKDPDRYTLDDFVARRGLASVDFIKIDTDGTDFGVLVGAERSLLAQNVMGVQIEANFNYYSNNTFAGIDIFMRQRGFSLFAMSQAHKYARQHLPGLFLHDFPSQGHFGQTLWCDAIYLRDVCRPSYFEFWPTLFDLNKFCNLLSLYDLYRLPDCAAELLRRFNGEIKTHVDTNKLMMILQAQAAAYDAAASKKADVGLKSQ